MEVAAAKQFLPMPPRDPNSPSSSSTSSSSPSSAASPSPSRHPLPPPSPRPVPRVIDTTPFPTTFVQADTASFKQVVQMLTGSDTPSSAQTKPAAAKNHHHHHGGGGSSGLAGVPCWPKKPAFKLYERRGGLKNLKMIAPLAMAAAAAAGTKTTTTPTEVLSPSVLNFPSLALGSPVTPLLADPFINSSSPASSSASPAEEEAAAMARNGFFLHPSPRSAAEPPRLLPLFPVTSPRMASSSAAAAPSSSH